MKKALALGLSFCMAATLIGCSSGGSTAEETQQSEAKTESSEAAEETSETAAAVSLDEYVYDGEPLEIHLGDINSQFPLNLAYNMGFLEEEFEGSNVTFTMDYFQNGPAISEAFASGNLDFAEFGEQGAISGISADYGYKIIGRNCDTETMYPLVVDADITDAESLKGAKIAVSVGTSAHYLLLTYLESMGLSENDIELVNTNDVVTLLASGEVQGAADQLAKFTSLIDAGEVHVLADGTASETCQISAFVGRDEFCEQYPEITAKVLRAVQRVDDWMAESEENQKEAFAKLAEITQREEEWFSTMYGGSNFGADLTEQDLRVLEEVLQFMKDNDLLSNPDITMDDILDLSYLELAGLR
ncbi:MAG TPA: NrtA/SsuA/CpmA family ABC transporter substrate-binding protein [Candidatus Lachnoclostridium pullistercoris]|uniref:NrtA/SsuA/CpmA family ABC transporter substrate-binding protein n=1 Tax=Candidatus Lachnoclostridium pullistercoris TaxID=2838632 RepID=A0A9D2PCA0_9FIRM|nr:NrtA/SsuA/CpmA family ABC transporter substrate-binding protein [Candidatus Lachnoclostridium pullistercoris]